MENVRLAEHLKGFKEEIGEIWFEILYIETKLFEEHGVSH
jgi:hypothetical protein